MLMRQKRTQRKLHKSAQRAGLTEGPVIAEAFYAWVQGLARMSHLDGTPTEARRGIFRGISVVILRLIGVLYVMAQAHPADLKWEFAAFGLAVSAQLHDGWQALNPELPEIGQDQDELPD